MQLSLAPLAPLAPLALSVVTAALALAAPTPAPLIDGDFVYPGPGAGATSTTDADATADGEHYGLAWRRKTDTGELICFATATSDGAADSPPIVVDALSEDALVTAGPAIARVEEKEFLVAYALVDALGRAEVRVARVAPDGEGGWDVVAGFVLPQPFYAPGDFADGIDVGRASDGVYVVWTIAGDLRWVGLWMNPVTVDPSLYELDGGVKVHKSGELFRNPCVTSGAPAPIAFFEIWYGSRRAIGYVELQNPYYLVWFISGLYSNFSAPAIAGEGDLQVLVMRDETPPGAGGSSGAASIRAYRLFLGPDGVDALGYGEYIAEFGGPAALRGPSIGQAGESRSFVAWKRFSQGAWRVEGVGLDPDVRPCEEPFEIAADSLDTMPRVSESPTAPYGSFVVWGGDASGASTPEARAATVSACD